MSEKAVERNRLERLVRLYVSWLRRAIEEAKRDKGPGNFKGIDDLPEKKKNQRERRLAEIKNSANRLNLGETEVNSMLTQEFDRQQKQGGSSSEEQG